MQGGGEIETIGPLGHLRKGEAGASSRVGARMGAGHRAGEATPAVQRGVHVVDPNHELGRRRRGVRYRQRLQRLQCRVGGAREAVLRLREPAVPVLADGEVQRAASRHHDTGSECSDVTAVALA